MAIISNAVTIADAGAFSASLGDMVHIKTLTASNTANLTFIHGSSSVVFNSTYPLYIFKFFNIRIASDTEALCFNVTTDGSNFNVAKQSNYYRSRHTEGDASTLEGQFGNSLANGTGLQNIQTDMASDTAHSLNGEMAIFNPAQTVTHKHFFCTTNNATASDATQTGYLAGYINTTSAVTGVRFQANTGNLTVGSIALYGIKDS